jgi:hypothetical protein
MLKTYTIKYLLMASRHFHNTIVTQRSPRTLPFIPLAPGKQSRPTGNQAATSLPSLFPGGSLRSTTELSFRLPATE